jgi:hypothetical protein
MTAKKDIFNIQSSPIGWDVNIDEKLKAYYAHQKQEYMRKYNLTELKQGKTKTALEAWNI